MSKLFHPLLTLIASATDHHLAKYVLYLKEENRILRNRIPGVIHTRPHERERLLKFGKVIGKGINERITIVTPGTFYRWVREEEHGRRKSHDGRPPKSVLLRELVIKIARETGFGYTRILGELRKLGIGRICRQTVKNIIKKEGIEPSPGEAPALGINFSSLIRKRSGPAISLRNGSSPTEEWWICSFWFSCTLKHEKFS